MTGGAQDSGVERTPAQFFFECGYGAAYADAYMENGQKPAFTLSDAAIERAWAIAPEAYEDHDEWERYMARATPAPAGWQGENVREALRRMIYEATHLSPCKPNGDHDCTIKAETLAYARAAYASTAPAKGGAA